MPSRLAAAAIGSTPRAGWMEPSSDSSPSSTTSAMCRRSTTPWAARMPSAIGRSNDAPALRTSAGARLTVIRWAGNSKPELRIALRTRSRLSRTPTSGRPTMREPRHPERDIHLDVDRAGIDAEHGRRPQAREHDRTELQSASLTRPSRFRQGLSGSIGKICDTAYCIPCDAETLTDTAEHASIGGLCLAPVISGPLFTQEVSIMLEALKHIGGGRSKSVQQQAERPRSADRERPAKSGAPVSAMLTALTKRQRQAGAARQTARAGHRTGHERRVEARARSPSACRALDDQARDLRRSRQAHPAR